ncbi:MAG TPA: methyltransferase domain-containing protein [Bryobacteraceae bacterium]
MRREVGIRSRFVRKHIGHHPDRAELMDLTRFMHGRPEKLVKCAFCGLAMREENAPAHYADDLYDPVLLAHLFPRYLQAFQEKERNYRELLRPRAEVLEVGSHLGAFLAAGEEWGWRPTGIDVGEYTSAFARRQGLRVKRTAIEDARIGDRSLDGVFIWNCFEQMERPREALGSLRPMLRRHGVLVIRVPNFAFYQNRRSLRELAFNNLLGFPYLTGHTPGSLVRLVRQFGFEPVAGFDSTLLILPFPNVSRELESEMEAAYALYRSAGSKSPDRLAGPWIEIAFRVV